jgi:hypothetical protein
MRNVANSVVFFCVTTEDTGVVPLPRPAVIDFARLIRGVAQIGREWIH